MADKFDPYREALVMETHTFWPDEYDHLDGAEKQRIESALHQDPENAVEISYLRTHTGFCRQITVSEDDIQRING